MTGLQNVYGTFSCHDYWKKQHKDIGLLFDGQYIINNIVRKC